MIRAFAPGRANLIGEHTDYNGGLALPFALSVGVEASAAFDSGAALRVRAEDLDEEAVFELAAVPDSRCGDWRDFVRGAVAELSAAGVSVSGGSVSLRGDVPQGSGLSSSAALEVALCLVLGGEPADRVELARLCSRIENEWVGARTGLLDQLASLLGEEGHATLIDFRSLETRSVPLDLGDWRLVAVDSGERHTHAGSGYNERRAECERACELLGIASLRDASPADAARLPAPLDRRVRHVVSENERVVAAVAALEAADLPALAELLDASHASLRDDYEASTPAVEATVSALRDAGAAGARMMGGGFGGQVLALLPPGVAEPQGAVALEPSRGARLL